MAQRPRDSLSMMSRELVVSAERKKALLTKHSLRHVTVKYPSDPTQPPKIRQELPPKVETILSS